jgi:DNA gyrase inhibitor GyrI/DNA-binding transcriptional MerR regulator
MYDEAALTRLGQIILLRRLRVSLKDINTILTSQSTLTALNILSQSMAALDSEITALSTVRDIIGEFVGRLKASASVTLHPDVFSDASMRHVMASLPLITIQAKEEKSMSELNQANEVLSKLRDVRIIQLPPCTVASYHFIGENPEETVGGVISKFTKDVDLYGAKPDARLFGFNHPSPSAERPVYGYESWVTIPDDMDVPEPLVKKRFDGGLYAVHSIKFGDFHEWDWLYQWAAGHGKYAVNMAPEGEEIMGGCLEEHLNWVYQNHLSRSEDGSGDAIGGQLDLYLPIKLK